MTPLIYKSHEHSEVILISPILFHWISNINFFIFITLYGFKGITCSEAFSPERYMDMIDRHQVTFVLVFPFNHKHVIESKLARPMKSVKTVWLGGFQITQDFVDSLAYFYPNAKLRSSYGSSELNIVTLAWREAKGTSSGFVFPNNHIKVRLFEGILSFLLTQLNFRLLTIMEIIWASTNKARFV